MSVPPPTRADVIVAYLYEELEFFLTKRSDQAAQDIAEYLTRLIPAVRDVSQEIVPFCNRHGIVPHSHRCAYFDDMPDQIIRRQIRE